MPDFQDLWLPSELRFDGIKKKGDDGKRVMLCQELLVLSGHRVSLDGDFGPATEAAVRALQGEALLPPTGEVDEATFGFLTRRFRAALTPIASENMTLGNLACAYAAQHLAAGAREAGGDNRGPWVRLYMNKHEGAEWKWCAGFATFVLKQAAETLGVAMPVARTFDCDELASHGKETGRFLGEKDFEGGTHTRTEITPGSLFLLRQGAGDWYHTGLVTAAEVEYFKTIEGNSNDNGEDRGYEVCRVRRGYKRTDFVRVD